MAIGISANRLELLQIADAVAREKGIEKEVVIEAIEDALQKAARDRYGKEHDIRVKIDPKTGETSQKRVIEVVADDTELEGEIGKVQISIAKRTWRDAEIGKVLDALKAAGLEENTLIVFTADHGECAGAHGFNQKTVFYEESARVPFIIRDPDNKVAGQATKRVTELLDLYPTVADLCGLQPDKRVQGKSLRPLLEAPDRPWANVAYTQVDFGAATRDATANATARSSGVTRNTKARSSARSVRPSTAGRGPCPVSHSAMRSYRGS